MPIGLFGGSFNPPHVGHLVVAEFVRDRFGLDRVLWIPAALPPHKGAGELAGPEHRLRMTRLATAGNPAFAVSDLELARGGVSYTVDTIRTLQEEDPSAEYVLLVGGDSFRSFATWRRPEEILSLVPLVVYERGDAGPGDPDTWPADRVRFARAPRLEISSSNIRERIAAGRSVRYLLPDAVADYVRAHGLYLSSPR